MSELSDKSGIHDATISRWIKQGNQPGIEQLRKLVKPLGVPLLKLLVVAGHLEPGEAQMRDVPTPPPIPSAATKIESDLLEQIAEADENTISALRGVLVAVRSHPGTKNTRSRLDENYEGA